MSRTTCKLYLGLNMVDESASNLVPLCSVYMNDDVFFNRPMQSADFHRHGRYCQATFATSR